MRILITPEPLDAALLAKEFSVSPDCGCVIRFEGIVRNHNGGKKVTAIEYECYAGMAKKELEAIAKEAAEQWPLREIFAAHRTGIVAVGEISFLLFVAAPHRREAFEAAQYIVDTMKRRAPIWKRELGET